MNAVRTSKQGSEVAEPAHPALLGDAALIDHAYGGADRTPLANRCRATGHSAHATPTGARVETAPAAANPATFSLLIFP